MSFKHNNKRLIVSFTVFQDEQGNPSTYRPKDGHILVYEWENCGDHDTSWIVRRSPDGNESERWNVEGVQHIMWGDSPTEGARSDER